MAKPEMIVAKHPDPEKQPTKMRKDRYDLVKAALLDVIPPKGDVLIALKDLNAAVKKSLKKTTGTDELPDGGSIGWNVMAVKLDLEARGLIQREQHNGTQHLFRTKK